jgi:hypothetical protein
MAYLACIICLLTGNAIAQTGTNIPSRHVGFNSPEGWALKYFTSVTLLSGLQPARAVDEEYRTGSLNVGLELGWIPMLSTERQRVGFSGRKEEDLNKAPILIRPTVRIGLPWRLSVMAAGPPPLQAFGVTPRLFALGLERPILERNQWRLGWRAYGQLGSVKGAFTCPERALAFPAGSDNNPSGCIGESADVASLRYAGSELQFAYRVPRVPRLTLHAAGGMNLIDSIFEVHAPLETRLDRNRLWTRGKTFSGTGGFSYLLSSRVALTVDAFYSPLWVRRDPAAPSRNDGLFNVRALLSYSLR